MSHKRAANAKSLSFHPQKTKHRSNQRNNSSKKISQLLELRLHDPKVDPALTNAPETGFFHAIKNLFVDQSKKNVGVYVDGDGKIYDMSKGPWPAPYFMENALGQRVQVGSDELTTRDDMVIQAMLPKAQGGCNMHIVNATECVNYIVEYDSQPAGCQKTPSTGMMSYDNRFRLSVAPDSHLAIFSCNKTAESPLSYKETLDCLRGVANALCAFTAPSIGAKVAVGISATVVILGVCAYIICRNRCNSTSYQQIATQPARNAEDNADNQPSVRSYQSR